MVKKLTTVPKLESARNRKRADQDPAEHQQCERLVIICIYRCALILITVFSTKYSICVKVPLLVCKTLIY